LTHSLHRKGERIDLAKDYVILAMLSRGINDKHADSRERLKKVGKILSNHHPTNIMQEKLWNVSPVITAAYDDHKNVRNALHKIKSEDLGISIVVSGLIDEVQSLANEFGFELNSIHLSLGTFGRVENLPLDEYLEITTMCGHHCISVQSITHYLEQVKEGKISVERAAEILAQPCVCGIFNTSRAATILNTLFKKKALE